MDLERHEEEWLRSEKRHRRLGFLTDEIDGWFEALGLRALPPVRLAGEKLAVVIWAAQLPVPYDQTKLERRQAA